MVWGPIEQRWSPVEKLAWNAGKDGKPKPTSTSPIIQRIIDRAYSSGQRGWNTPTVPPDAPSEARTPAGPQSTVDPRQVLDTVNGMFPWLGQLGLTDQILNWVQDGLTSPDALVANIRNSGQWKQRFVGIRRQSGELRMNEGQYLQRETEYRQLLKQHGRQDSEYDDPNDFRAFFENEIDPNELGERSKVYEEVRRGSDDIKDAFYVYAGMKVSDDDLYLATVNPERAQSLIGEYNQRVSRSELDWDTFKTRATEAGLDRVNRRLSELQEQGVSAGDVVDRVRALDPQFASQMMEALYSNGSERFLNLEELQRSFEYAMIGSAAKLNGFELPGAQRIEAFRQAGINRARALEGYGQIKKNQGWVQAALQRSHRASEFSVEDFEDALFLSKADETQLLEQAQKYEASLGQRTGTANFYSGSAGELQQRGLRAL